MTVAFAPVTTPAHETCFQFHASTSPQCSLRADAIDSMFKLTVDANSSLPPIKSNPIVRLNGRPFKNSAFPCVIRPGWQRQSESLADLYGSGRKESTGSLLANDSGQIVLSCKPNDHFRRTSGMSVYKKSHPSVKCFTAQFFRLWDDWPLGQHCWSKLQCQRPKGLLGSGNTAEAGETVAFRNPDLA